MEQVDDRGGSHHDNDEGAILLDLQETGHLATAVGGTTDTAAAGFAAAAQEGEETDESRPTRRMSKGGAGGGSMRVAGSHIPSGGGVLLSPLSSARALWSSYRQQLQQQPPEKHLPPWPPQQDQQEHLLPQQEKQRQPPLEQQPRQEKSAHSPQVPRKQLLRWNSGTAAMGTVMAWKEQAVGAEGKHVHQSAGNMKLTGDKGRGEKGQVTEKSFRQQQDEQQEQQQEQHASTKLQRMLTLSALTLSNKSWDTGKDEKGDGPIPMLEAHSPSAAKTPTSNTTTSAGEVETVASSEWRPLQRAQEQPEPAAPKKSKLLASPFSMRFSMRFKVGEKLGEGGYGYVERCDDLTGRLSEPLAVKTVYKRPIGKMGEHGLGLRELTAIKDKLEALKRERKLLALLSGHDHIVQVKKIYDYKDRVRLVMELCSGGNLRDYLVTRIEERKSSGMHLQRGWAGGLAEHEAVLVMRQLASALHFCHGRLVVHRDIKLENILLVKKHPCNGCANCQVASVGGGDAEGTPVVVEEGEWHEGAAVPRSPRSPCGAGAGAVDGRGGSARTPERPATPERRGVGAARLAGVGAAWLRGNGKDRHERSPSDPPQGAAMFRWPRQGSTPIEDSSMLKSLPRSNTDYHDDAHADERMEQLDMPVVKLADFGLARQLTSSDQLVADEFCGTDGYMAPEVVGCKPYGLAVDVWSLGVLLHGLLFGELPRYDKPEDVITEGVPRPSGKKWDMVSRDAQDLLQSMLQLDPLKRITSLGMVEHPWFLQPLHLLAPTGAKEGGSSSSPLVVRFRVGARAAMAIKVINPWGGLWHARKHMPGRRAAENAPKEARHGSPLAHHHHQHQQRQPHET